MLVYLDNCCYNRPFDDLSRDIIRTESEAKIFIQSLIKYGMIELMNSFILMYEISRSPSIYKKEHILTFIEKNASGYVSGENQENVINISREIIATGVKPIDAAHIACAIIAKCDYFITTDKRILKYNSNKIKLVNLVDFVKIWEVDYGK